MTKGAEYKKSKIIGSEFLKKIGSKVKVIRMLKNYSTTNIIKKIKKYDSRNWRIRFHWKKFSKKIRRDRKNKKKLCVVDKKKLKSKKFKYFNNIDFLNNFKKAKFAKKVKFIFHQGANSNTAEKNFKLIMNDNYFYTIDLIDLCEKYKIPIVYASSASVYGISPNSFDEKSKMMPANYYSISKSLVDTYVDQKLKKTKN